MRLDFGRGTSAAPDGPRMKSPATLFIALFFAILFSLIAYRVSVHFAQVPDAGGAAVEANPAAPATPAAPNPTRQQAMDAIARAAPIQAAVQAHFETTGNWPRSLAELSLGNPDQYADHAVATISIQPQGVVAVSMKPHVARGGVIRLIPVLQPDDRIEWQCRATNYPAATRLPDCR